MSRPLLLLRLEGPLQAWGTRSRWDVRDTGPEPTKSGLVGLLGCALGYGHGDRRLVEELDTGLQLGVRTEAPGRVLEDFQTVTDFLPTAAGDFRVSGGIKSAAALRADPDARPATIISPRFYLEDAAFFVVLAGDAPLLARCADALRRPCWPLFLGRKACVPTRPILESLTVDYEGLEDALCRHPWAWEGVGRRAPYHTLSAWVEDPSGDVVRQDALRQNAARQYGFRRVRSVSVPWNNVDPHKETN